MSADRITVHKSRAMGVSELIGIMDYAHQEMSKATAIPRLLIERPTRQPTRAEMVLHIDNAMERMRRDLVRQYHHWLVRA